MKRKKALFCILNWGLGHATRSIPIINELEQQGWDVIIATDGIPLHFLQNEFPNHHFEKLPGYNITYDGKSIFWIILKQIPNMILARQGENKRVRQIVKDHNIQLVISDNRFGCYDKKVTSIFMTHQWNLLYSDLKVHKLATWLNQKMILRYFDKVWIPDDPQLQMSGILSENNPDNIYTGIISRFNQDVQTKEKNIDLLFILSGPEPLRSTLEKKCTLLANELTSYTIHLVRGTTKDRSAQYKASSHVMVYDLVKSDELESLIKKAKFIVSRSGYTSLMDYLHLGVTNLLLIPTPMQTEQEYLAIYFSEKFDTVETTTEDQLSLNHLQKGLNQPAVESKPTENVLLSKIISEIGLKQSQK